MAFALFAGYTASGQALFVEQHSNPNGGSLRGIASSDALLVTVGDAGRILHSADGTAWTESTSGISQNLRGVAQGSGQFVAVGDGGRIIASQDGTTWTVANSATTISLNAVAYGAGRWVAVGGNGTIVSSTDALSWTSRNSGLTTSLRGVGWMEDAAMFVAVGDQGTILLSRDAVAWAPGVSGTQDDILGVTAGGVFFYAVLKDAICTGTPTLALNREAGVGLGTFRSVAKQPTPGAFAMAIGDGGVADASNGRWRQVQSGTTKNLLAACYARGVFFAVGDQESIFRGASAQPTPPQDTVRNLSTRAQASAGAGTLISGFVIGGSGTKRVLVRASGPTLGTFGVSQVLAQPTLTVFDASGKIAGRNTGWGSAGDADQIRTMAAVTGAFAFPDNSADCALLLSLSPGAYTAQVSGPTTGIGLIEIYDTEFWPEFSTASLINISSRCFVGVGDATAITGVALPKGRRLLIRAVGPGLQQFGVTGVVSDPMLELIQPESTSGTPSTTHTNPARTLAVNDNWNSATSMLEPLLASAASADDVRAFASKSGAFPLTENSRDAAMVVTLVNNGTFTVKVSSADGGSGIALVEIYDLGPP